MDYLWIEYTRVLLFMMDDWMEKVNALMNAASTIGFIRLKIAGLNDWVNWGNEN